eukprot:2755845-Amphidinium_carterae.1
MQKTNHYVANINRGSLIAALRVLGCKGCTSMQALCPQSNSKNPVALGISEATAFVMLMRKCSSRQAFLANTRGASECTHTLHRMKIWLIFVSTDYVFDGTTPPYSHTAEPNPLNGYGKQKYEVLSCCPREDPPLQCRGSKPLVEKKQT